MNKSEILDYIKTSQHPLTKREIAQAFRAKGSGAKIELKRILRELEQDGAIAKNAGGGYAIASDLPSVAVIRITGVDIDGDVFAAPIDWNEAAQGPPPRIEVKPDRKGHPSVMPDDRMLARINLAEDGTYEARIIRRLDTPKDRMLGLVRITKNGPILQPTDKKAKHDFDIAPTDLNGAKDGDLAVAEALPARGKFKKARVVDVIGRRDDVKAISLISLYEAGIQPKFPDAVMKATERMKVPSPENREDLRNIPLVTIDGLDARDFDDAVFAEKDGDGFHLIVAIADVAYYVRSGDAIDVEGQKRGNSTYFPDRVVPMLPEALSNDLCSLRPHEPRACLAVHLWIDAHGALTKYKFVRGLMESKARLTYEQAQAARDGITDKTTQPLIKTVIEPLYEAFKILDEARKNRGALDLDLPERKVVIDESGRMAGIKQRERLDSHRLIEEFMVLANVAAAKALEARRAPCVYRIHDRPSMEKLDNVREFIESFGLSMPKGAVNEPKQLNYILQHAAKLPYSHLISTVMLRCQSQAVYSSENIGHFGLALQRYAHFTSPIRRYADLLVHRSLISAYQLGPGGIDQGEVAKLEEICEHISGTERTSMEAERNSVDRFTAAFLSTQIGAEFAGRITGVTRFGLFVELNESGADGLVPMRTLPNDFYIHDEHAHALIGRRSGRVFRLGAPVTVKLKEADGLTGSTLLELVGHGQGADIPGMELKIRHKGSRRERQKPHKKRDFKRHKDGPRHRRR